MANVDLTRFELLKTVMRERFGDPATLERERRQPVMPPSDEQLRRQEVLRSIRS
jgi:hypothetical protein